MVFTSPSWVPELPSPPDSVSIPDFMLDEQYGRYPLSKSRDPYTCGLTGKTYTTSQVKERVANLAKALAKELQWEVNTGSEYDKVAGVFCFNTVDMMTLFWSIHRLNAIVTPANAAYSTTELAYQLENAGATCLFTCVPLLPTALEAAKKVKIPSNRIYLLPVPDAISVNGKAPEGMKTLDDLISAGSKLPQLPDLQWKQGQGARQTAFLCYSSGTSGLPKGVQISHRNVIANVLQKKTYDSSWRKKHTNSATEIALGLLPQNHIYALVGICHTSTYRGDQVIVLPKYEFQPLLQSIARFKIQELFVVPPIIVTMTRNIETCKKYDLSSVKYLFTGAAPLGEETILSLAKMYPDWILTQGYGLTETCTICCAQSRDDLWPGSSGSLYPGMIARVVSPSGEDITSYNTPGELWIQSPSVTLGYLKNEKANTDTFVTDPSADRWMRTGDEVEVRVSPTTGTEHIWIMDRIKELIKVKGNQVPPAELEAHLLTHPSVEDCAVISIPDGETGEEAPKAFVVKSKSVGIEDNERMLKREIIRYVQKHKARYKWVKEVEFVDVVPKSASGKILRRLLRDRDRERRKKEGGSGAKL